MEHILNLEQVKKYYGGNSGNITKAVDGISMYVDKGEFVAIMGASGSGKTTLRCFKGACVMESFKYNYLQSNST